MDQISQIIENSIGMSRAVQVKFFNTFIIIFVLWLIRFILRRIIYRQTEDVKTRYVWMKTITYVVVLLGLIMVGSVWFKGFKELGTYLGLLSAGIAIALKDPLTNIAGWLFIMFRRTFTVGDRVQIGEKAGDVIDIRIFQFILLEIGNWVDADQSTGRVIYIPNGQIFTQAVANYSKGFQYIWDEINVLVTFESDWKKAKDIMLEIAKKHAEHLSKSAERRIREASKKYMIFYKNLTPTVYTAVKESGVQLTIRYLCEPRSRRSTQHAIWEEILESFAREKGIDFAYPTTRFYDNTAEGKQTRQTPSDARKSVKTKDKQKRQ
ncbi:MAG TPA: mechanosensitive ion channel family protein [Candidatus Marinimicrobia bacterium]|nr:mechanosensitive ion channel family protein [Candidatus Neomarinimicrobiota bacterium]